MPQHAIGCDDRSRQRGLAYCLQKIRKQPSLQETTCLFTTLANSTSAHHLDDAVMTFGNHRLNNFGTPRFEHSQGARFVTLHQAAEADYIDS